MANFMYQSSEHENAARAKLDRYVQELRSSLLDLLEMVDDRPDFSMNVPMSEPDRLRRAARKAESRAHKIRRAREIIDGTIDASKLTGQCDHRPAVETR